MKKLISITICVITVLTLSLSLFLIDASATSLPSQYNNDIENPMYVTSVKDQAKYGVCWAFSAVSCCESEAIKNHGANKDTLDLSELHLAYFAYNAQKTGTGDTITTTMPFYEIGGDISLAMLTLSNWIGLVSEDTAKFSDFLDDPDITLDQSLAYKKPDYYIKNAYRYNYATDIELIKQAIIDFGAIQTGYFADDAFLNETTAAYYCPQTLTMNHAISIIGWDDNYPKENFSVAAKPYKNGAWLVKNSWGESYGTDGYFWLSYEDKSIQDAVAYDVEPASSFLATKNYQHDGGFSLIYYNYDTINAANVFTAENDESIVSVSVFTHKAENTPYTLRIYKNPSSLSPNTFMNGELVHQQDGNLTFSGINTIDLTSYVSLKKGDIFIVSIETSALLGFDGTQAISDGYQIISQSTVSVLPNQTYVSIDNEGYYDLSLTQGSARPTNVRIKAFTKTNETKGEATVSSLPTMKTIEYGQTLKASELIGGKVIDSISNNTISGKWNFKNENTIISGNAQVEIIFIPDDHNYDTITETIQASVSQVLPTISVSANSDVYKSGEPIILELTLTNPHLSALSDFGSVTYTYKVDDGDEQEFNGPVFDIENIQGKTLYITVTSNEVNRKYLSVSKTLEFIIYEEETQATETVTETITEIITELVTETETEIITETKTEIATETITETVTETITELVTESETLPVTETQTETVPTVTEELTNETSNETNNNNTDNTTEENADSENFSEETSVETLTEQKTEAVTETAEESSDKSIEDQLMDGVSESFGCSSSLSLSAIFCVLTLSTITITKKRKH